MGVSMSRSRAGVPLVLVLAIVGNSCGDLSPRRVHRIEGTYDIAMSFTGTERRGPCPPPQPGYCYPNDGVAFTGTGVLTLSRASRPSGEATFFAEFLYNGKRYATDIGNLGVPTVTGTGSFSIPLFYADFTSWAEFEGLLNGDAISGSVEVGVSNASRSFGSFTGQRRR